MLTSRGEAVRRVEDPPMVTGSARYTDDLAVPGDPAAAVDDSGRLVNPLLAEGQVHGGIAQGVGQALFEEVRYDADGNNLTGTFASYTMPSAAEFPSFETARMETPSPLNPLGAKGIGESGAIGSTPAVHNAVVDALRPYGVTDIEMPTTPERVWRAIASAQRP